MNENEFLEHYGIKRRSGRFRWGSGKRPFQSGGAPGTKSSPSQNNPPKETTLTNEQIKARNDRQRLINESLRLQREFTSLTKKDKSAGRKFVEDIIKDSGKKIIVGYTVAKVNQSIQKGSQKLKEKK